MISFNPDYTIANASHDLVPTNFDPPLHSKRLAILVEDYLNGIFLKGLSDRRFLEARRVITSYKEQELMNALEKLNLTDDPKIATKTLREIAREISAKVLQLQHSYLYGSTDCAFCVLGTARDEVWQLTGLAEFSNELAKKLLTRFSLVAGGFKTGCLSEIDKLIALTHEPTYYGPQLGGWIGDYIQEPLEPRSQTKANSFVSIDNRTGAIFSLTNLGGAIFFPGTAGTLEEFSSVMLGLVNCDKHYTFFTHRKQVGLPVFLFDTELYKNYFYDGLIKLIKEFSRQEQKRFKDFLEKFFIVRKNGIYQIKIGKNGFRLIQIKKYGFGNDPQSTVDFIEKNFESTYVQLNDQSIILPKKVVNPLLEELERKIDELSKPLSDIPEVNSSDCRHEVLSTGEFLDKYCSPNQQPSKIFPGDIFELANNATKAGSYPGKETFFGSVLQATITFKDGRKEQFSFTGSNIAESARYSTCAEENAIRNLSSYVLQNDDVEFVKIDGVFVQGSFDKELDLKFFCSCQSCRETFQNLYNEGIVDDTTVFAYRSGRDSNCIHVTDFNDLAPVSSAKLAEVNTLSFLKTFSVLKPCELDVNESRLVAETVSLCKKSKSIKRAHGAFLLDGQIVTVCDRNLETDDSIGSLRSQVNQLRKGVYQAFCYVVKEDDPDSFATIRARIRENYLTASQISGYDCWVYGVKISTDGEILSIYRIRASELFPSGKGMGDSKKYGGDIIGLVCAERKWLGEPVNGSIEDHPDFMQFLTN